jgi:hypothetical protein
MGIGYGVSGIEMDCVASDPDTLYPIPDTPLFPLRLCVEEDAPYFSMTSSSTGGSLALRILAT